MTLFRTFYLPIGHHSVPTNISEQTIPTSIKLVKIITARVNMISKPKIIYRGLNFIFINYKTPTTIKTRGLTLSPVLIHHLTQPDKSSFLFQLDFLSQVSFFVFLVQFSYKLSVTLRTSPFLIIHRLTNRIFCFITIFTYSLFFILQTFIHFISWIEHTPISPRTFLNPY